MSLVENIVLSKPPYRQFEQCEFLKHHLEISIVLLVSYPLFQAGEHDCVVAAWAIWWYLFTYLREAVLPIYNCYTHLLLLHVLLRWHRTFLLYSNKSYLFMEPFK